MIAVIIILVLAALYLLLGYLGFRVACGRIQDADWDSKEALEKSMWKPVAGYILRSGMWVKAHESVDVSTTSYDGLKLVGKWVPAENPIGTIIMFHGYHSSHLTDFGTVFDLYHSLGLNMLMVRQRAHGGSGGKYLTYGVKEHKDVLSWIEFHNREHGADNVLLSGVSMGSSTILYAAGEELSSNVKGIIADCGFTSPAEILTHVIQNGMHLPAKPVMPLMRFYARHLGGFDLDGKHTRDTLKNCKIPVLFIHGTTDTFVPCHMSQTSYDACASEKEIVLVEGAGHGRSFSTDPTRVSGAMKAFILRNICPQEVHP